MNEEPSLPKNKINKVAKLLAIAALAIFSAYFALRAAQAPAVQAALAGSNESSMCLCFVPYEVSIGESSRVDAACGEQAASVALSAVQYGLMPFSRFRSEHKVDYLLIYKDTVPLAYQSSLQSRDFDYSKTEMVCKRL